MRNGGDGPPCDYITCHQTRAWWPSAAALDSRGAHRSLCLFPNYLTNSCANTGKAVPKDKAIKRMLVRCVGLSVLCRSEGGLGLGSND